MVERGIGITLADDLLLTALFAVGCSSLGRLMERVLSQPPYLKLIIGQRACFFEVIKELN